VGGVLVGVLDGVEGEGGGGVGVGVKVVVVEGAAPSAAVERVYFEAGEAARGDRQALRLGGVEVAPQVEDAVCVWACVGSWVGVEEGAQACGGGLLGAWVGEPQGVPPAREVRTITLAR
jgi:hypothetical protein